MECIMNTLVVPLKNFISDRYEYVSKCEQHVNDLSDNIWELESLQGDFETKLNCLTRTTGEKRSQQAQNWLDSVSQLVKDAANIKAKYDKRVKCMGDISPAVWSTYQLSKDAETMIGKVKARKEQKDDIKDLTMPELAPEVGIERPVGSSIIGMDSVLDELRGYIRDKNVNTIGVYGQWRS